MGAAHQQRVLVQLLTLAAAAAPAQVYSLAWSPDGNTLAAGGYREVRLLDPQGKPATKFAGHADAVRALAWSPDGQWLAAAGGLPGRKGEVKLWRGGRPVATLTGHADAIYAVAFSPDGAQLATAGYDRLIKLWDRATGTELRTLKDHIDAVYALRFTPDGARLVSASADRSVKVWNPRTGERLYTLSDSQDGLWTMALDPRGRRVAAAGSDKTIRVWALGDTSATLEGAMIAHEDAVLRLAWSPDGEWLVSGGADRRLKWRRAATLAEAGAAAQSDWITGLEFAPGGKQLAIARHDGSVEVKPWP